MAKVRLGIDQVTAWVLAVALCCALFGGAYFATKFLARAADEGVQVGETHEEGHEAAAGHDAEAVHDAAAPADHDAPKHEAAPEHGAAPEHEAAPEHAEEPKEEHSAEPKASASHDDTHWTYAGSSGPDHWSGLSPSYKACDVGKRQSPVDIDAPTNSAKLLPLKFHYKLTEILVKNNGHTIQGDASQGNYIEVEGERYDLLQFHFHAPSEHKVAGVPYDLELHLVHKNADGQLAVVGVLFEEGVENRSLAKIWSIMPTKPGAYDEPIEIDPMTYLPSRRLYYNYWGSLTTPPCTEGVKWFVLTTPVSVSPKQVDKFVSVAKFNARPVQPLGARQVMKSTR